MQLKPEFLPVGSVVEYNIGTIDCPDWQPTKLDWQDLKYLTEQHKDFNEIHRPIPLTEKILTEWCKFQKVKNKIDIFEKGRIRLWLGSRGQSLVYLIEEDTTTGHYINSIEYLHELQLLFLAHKQPLPIQIK